MKLRDWTDDAGRLWRVATPDDFPETLTHQGVPVGPPSLAALGLPLDVEVRLHNELHSRGIFTRRDILARPNHVQAALQAVFRVDLQRLQMLYLTEQGG